MREEREENIYSKEIQEERRKMKKKENAIKHLTTKNIIKKIQKRRND